VTYWLDEAIDEAARLVRCGYRFHDAVQHAALNAGVDWQAIQNGLSERSAQARAQRAIEDGTKARDLARSAEILDKHRAWRNRGGNRNGNIPPDWPHIVCGATDWLPVGYRDFVCAKCNPQARPDRRLEQLSPGAAPTPDLLVVSGYAKIRP
jgi:hypothetical protein